MKNIIIVFKSKTEVFEFIDKMRENGIKATTVGTPSRAKIGCGISAKISSRYLWLAKKIFREGNYTGFYKIYEE